MLRLDENLAEFRTAFVAFEVEVVVLVNAFMSIRSFISKEAARLPVVASSSELDGEASWVGEEMDEAEVDEADEEDVDGVSSPMVCLFDDDDDNDGDESEDGGEAASGGVLSDFSLIMLEMKRSAHQCSKSRGTKPFRCGCSVAGSTCRSGPFWVPSSLVYFSQTKTQETNRTNRVSRVEETWSRQGGARIVHYVI